eukprot:12261216-Alexandrium_andersonii.AAC.1
MAPARGARPPAQSAPTGGAGEWTQAQRKGTVRRAQLPQKSARAEVAVESGFHPAGGPEVATPVSPFTFRYCSAHMRNLDEHEVESTAS